MTLFDSQTCYILSDDTEFNISGIGNITGTKYLENYEIYKQTLIEGLATKTHFSDLFSTWNREVFPRSQATQEISDSQSAHTGTGGAGNGPSDIGVTNILQQLSLEEVDENSDDEEENDKGNNKEVDENSDDEEENDKGNNKENDEDDEEEDEEDDEGTRRRIRSGRLHSDHESDEDDDFYASDPLPPTRSVPSAQTQRAATATIVTTDIQATPNVDAVGGLQDRRGSAAPKAPKKTPANAVRRSSGRNTKGPSVTANVEPLIPSPIQSINTADGLPKPTRAIRGATKGKSKAHK